MPKKSKSLENRKSKGHGKGGKQHRQKRGELLKLGKTQPKKAEETKVGLQGSSGDEEEEEVELNGPTKYKPSWLKHDEEPFNPAEFGPASEEAEKRKPPVPAESVPAVEEDQDAEAAEDAEETDDEEDFSKQKPLVPVRTVSCDGNIETFVGTSLRVLLKQSSESRGESALSPLVPRLDTKPLPGIEKPRFIWQSESEMMLRAPNREIEVAKFNDTSVTEPLFRIWRNPEAKDPNQQKEAEEVEAEETESKYVVNFGGQDAEEELDDLISLETLQLIRPCFDKGPLTMAEYFTAVSQVLHLPPNTPFPKSLLEIFVKVDVFGTQKISWDDLCDFLQQKYAEKAETEYSSPPVDLHLPSKPFETPHRSPASRALTLPDGGLLTFSEDGIVALWTGNFQIRIWRSLGKPASLRSQTMVDRKSKWFTDIVLLQQLSKYAVTTGERELQFYDTSTYDPYCQLTHLSTVPIRMDAKIKGNGLVVVMGDMTGILCILVIENALDTLRNWSQQRRVNSVPTIKLKDAVGTAQGVHYLKYKVHSDMISHVFYVISMNRVISSSMDSKASLAMGKLFVTKNANELMEDLSSNYLEGITDIHAPPHVRKSADEVRFPITQGCRTFDLWEEKRWLAAGGLDRLVWVWNLYVPTQPIAKLRGHNAAIFRVIFDVRSETLFSFCNDKHIRIWNLYTNTCIHVFEPKLTKLRGPISYCFFPTTDAVFVQTSVEACYIRLRRKGDDTRVEGMTHDDPVTAVIYNPHHEFFMTCSSEDILVWECRTGKLVSQFNTIGGDGSMHLDTIQSKLEKTMEEESHFIMPNTFEHGRELIDTFDVGIVTAVALDKRGRRFFTAHNNRVIKIWNFYNGRNLYNLYKPTNNLVASDTWGFMSIWTTEDNLAQGDPAGWFPKAQHREGRNKLVNTSEHLGLRLMQQGFGEGPVQLRLVRTWKCHVDAFVAMDVSETFGLIVTGGRDCSVRIWDMEGRHLGVLSQHTWVVGDPTTYAPSHPPDVLLDMKRIRGLDVFRKTEAQKQPLEMETRAEDRAHLLIEKKRNKLLSANEIWKKTQAYEILREYEVPTTVWYQPDCPVGPYRRSKAEKTEDIEMDQNLHQFQKIKCRKKKVDYADM